MSAAAILVPPVGPRRKKCRLARDPIGDLCGELERREVENRRQLATIERLKLRLANGVLVAGPNEGKPMSERRRALMQREIGGRCSSLKRNSRKIEAIAAELLRLCASVGAA